MLAKIAKPWWWKPLWTVSAIGIILCALVLFLNGFTPEKVILGAAFAFTCLGFAYYIRIRPSFKLNRAVYICLGLGVGWVMWLIYAFSGAGTWVADAIGALPALITSDAAFYVAGFLIGDWIGQQRNYQLPLWP